MQQGTLYFVLHNTQLYVYVSIKYAYYWYIWGEIPVLVLLRRCIYPLYLPTQVRDDGMIWHNAEELAAEARMLTILALYHSYSGGDGAFLLQYFDKARGTPFCII